MCHIVALDFFCGLLNIIGVLVVIKDFVVYFPCPTTTKFFYGGFNLPDFCIKLLDHTFFFR